MRELELDGVRLRSYESGSGERTLVFVHGVLTNSNVWAKVIERLAPEFRCVALDLPLGSHLAPVPGADLTPTGMAKLIADAIDVIGPERATLVGNDTGGAISQIVAARHPQRLDRLVLTSCEYRGNFPPWLFKFMVPLARSRTAMWIYLAPGHARRLLRLPLGYGWLAKRPFEPRTADSYARPAVQSRAIMRDFTTFLRTYRKDYAIAAGDALRYFDKPVLVVWAREDKVFRPITGEALARAFPAAELEWLDDSYGLSPEDQPERLAELISGFVTESRPASALTADG